MIRCIQDALLEPPWLLGSLGYPAAAQATGRLTVERQVELFRL